METTTFNAILGKIETRIKFLGTLKIDMLRMEHQYSSEIEVPNLNFAKTVTKGMSREEIIADIIVDEFSLEYDVEIEIQ